MNIPLITIYDGNGNAIPVPAFKGPKGDTGNTGATGASAYQVAVANGFEGTEAQWLASLKGATGDATTMKAIAPENDDAPPSAAAVYEAIQNFSGKLKLKKQVAYWDTPTENYELDNSHDSIDYDIYNYVISSSETDVNKFDLNKIYYYNNYLLTGRLITEHLPEGTPADAVIKIWGHNIDTSVFPFDKINPEEDIYLLQTISIPSFQLNLVQVSTTSTTLPTSWTIYGVEETEQLNIDNEPTENSNGFLTSGNIYNALQNASVELEAGNYIDITTNETTGNNIISSSIGEEYNTTQKVVLYNDTNSTTQTSSGLYVQQLSLTPKQINTDIPIYVTFDQTYELSDTNFDLNETLSTVIMIEDSFQAVNSSGVTITPTPYMFGTDPTNLILDLPNEAEVTLKLSGEPDIKLMHINGDEVLIYQKLLGLMGGNSEPTYEEAQTAFSEALISENYDVIYAWYSLFLTRHLFYSNISNFEDIYPTLCLLILMGGGDASLTIQRDDSTKPYYFGIYMSENMLNEDWHTDLCASNAFLNSQMQDSSGIPNQFVLGTNKQSTDYMGENPAATTFDIGTVYQKLWSKSYNITNYEDLLEDPSTTWELTESNKPAILIGYNGSRYTFASSINPSATYEIYQNKPITVYRTLPDTAFMTDNYFQIEDGKAQTTIGLPIADKTQELKQTNLRFDFANTWTYETINGITIYDQWRGIVRQSSSYQQPYIYDPFLDTLEIYFKNQNGDNISEQLEYSSAPYNPTANSIAGDGGQDVMYYYNIDPTTITAWETSWYTNRQKQLAKGSSSSYSENIPSNLLTPIDNTKPAFYIVIDKDTIPIFVLARNTNLTNNYTISIKIIHKCFNQLPYTAISTVDKVTLNDMSIPTANAVAKAVQSAGTIKKVHNSSPDDNGNIDAMYWAGTAGSNFNVNTNTLNGYGDTSTVEKGAVTIYNNSTYVYNGSSWTKMGGGVDIYNQSSGYLVKWGPNNNQLNNAGIKIVVDTNSPTSEDDYTNTLWFVTAPLSQE